LSVCLTKYHDINMYGGVEAQLYTFLNLEHQMEVSGQLNLSQSRSGHRDHPAS